MYATQKNQLRNLSKTEFKALRQLCRLSKNLYNVGLYSVRQYFFQERRFLRYESNYHYCKENENYKTLNTDIAQQTLKVIDRSFRSFFNLIKLAKEGQYQEKVRLPKYLPKDGYFPLIIPRFKVKDRHFNVPMSSEFRKEFGNIKIPFPERLNAKIVKEIRIHPRYDARFFEVEFVYIQEEEPQKINLENVLSIDLGLDNLATCVTNTGASFILDGKKLKSVNQWYNKENARLQSIKDKQGIKISTNKQITLVANRNNFVRDSLNKTARYIIDYCIRHQVSKIIVGFNQGWKQNINIGKRNNQMFSQIPHYSLRKKLQSLCERYGIEFNEQEESYTSKASFLDMDEIPVFNAGASKEYIFSGKRISRGQYRFSNGTIINADVNGALNILRKSNQISDFALLTSGCLAQPLRIRLR